MRYGGIHAVKGIDLEVREGELVCLIGANGAGKTTTLKAISGLIAVTRGKRRATTATDIVDARSVHELPRSAAWSWCPRAAASSRSSRSRRTCDGRLRARRRRRHRTAQFAHLSAPEGAPPPDRRHALGRRAADARHRARADEPAEAAAARRAVDGPGADHGGEDLRGRARHRGARRHDPAGRAERAPRARGWRTAAT